jgi:hypothetical protein
MSVFSKDPRTLAKLSKRLEVDYSNVLVAMFELMMRGGLQEKDLSRICAASIKRAEVKSRMTRREDSGGLVTAALVLDAWHRDRRYLNSRGTPKSVRLLGPTPSVEALIRAQKVSERASDIAHHLKAVQLVVPSGRNRYKPASDVAVISARDPLVLQHAARALATLLETVDQNVSGARSLAPLIERFAEVPDLPRKHIVDFQRFTQTQGRTFLRTINDWLESRRARQPSRRGTNGTVRAGVHTYAYVATKKGHASAYRTRRLLSV